MSDLESRNLIYDWNLKGSPELSQPAWLDVVDDTLWSGALSASGRDPGPEGRAALLRGMASTGIAFVHLGNPSHSEQGRQHIESALSLLKAEGLRLTPLLSVGPRAEQVKVAAACAPGCELRIHRSLSDPCLMAVRLTQEDALRQLLAAVQAAQQARCQPVWVAEDVTRTSPTHLAAALTALAASGVTRVSLNDSVGLATPAGVRRLLAFVREQAPSLRLEWGGRNDRGLATINALVALSHGADRIVCSMLGLGEGAGVVALDTLLTNLALMGYEGADLLALKDYCLTVSRVCQVAVPVNYPVFGGDAFRTATGVHAAAIVKARKKGDVWLADRVYSGIPAALFGLQQVVDIGPMSGVSNVTCWLEDRDVPYSQEDVARILQRAKQSNRTLTEAEVRDALAPVPQT